LSSITVAAPDLWGNAILSYQIMLLIKEWDQSVPSDITIIYTRATNIHVLVVPERKDAIISNYHYRQIAANSHIAIR
jgi:hypothetical protein